MALQQVTVQVWTETLACSDCGQSAPAAVRQAQYQQLQDGTSGLLATGPMIPDGWSLVEVSKTGTAGFSTVVCPTCEAGLRSTLGQGA